MLGAAQSNVCTPTRRYCRRSRSAVSGGGNSDRRRYPSRDVSLDAPTTDRERDGLASLHDTEAEAGDESEVADLFDLDRTEARALGAELDRADRGESQLD